MGRRRSQRVTTLGYRRSPVSSGLPGPVSSVDTSVSGLTDLHLSCRPTRSLLSVVVSERGLIPKVVYQ